MQTSAEGPKITFASCLSLKCRRKGTKKSERRPPVSLRPCAGVQPRSSVQLVTYHACQRSGTTCCSTSDHLKESHDTEVKAQGKATRTAWQSTISSGQLWLIRILQLVISRECFWWGEAEREWWEAEVTNALHCVLWKTKHPSARSPQNKKWTKQQLLASAVQVMVLELCCLTRKQNLQGIHCFA